MKTWRFSSSWMLIVLGAALSAGCESTSSGEEEDAAQEATKNDDASDPPAEGGGALSASCTAHVVGDGTCAGPDELKGLAFDVCSSEGRTMAELVFTFDCGDGTSTTADVVCCEPGTSATDPNSSLFGVLGDGETCVANATYLQLATEACTEAGLVLHDLATTEDCEGGAARWAKYLCLE